MAGYLPKRPNEFDRMDGARVAVMAAMWHPECVEPMIARAVSELERLGATAEVHRLPGSYELPMAARILFSQRPELDLIIAFGVVLTGATTHNLSVLQEVNSGFSRVMHDLNKIIINEVIGVSDIDDAIRRSGHDDMNKGVEAVFAASEILAWQRGLKN